MKYLLASERRRTATIFFRRCVFGSSWLATAVAWLCLARSLLPHHSSSHIYHIGLPCFTASNSHIRPLSSNNSMPSSFKVRSSSALLCSAICYLCSHWLGGWPRSVLPGSAGPPASRSSEGASSLTTRRQTRSLTDPRLLSFSISQNAHSPRRNLPKPSRCSCSRTVRN